MKITAYPQLYLQPMQDIVADLFDTAVYEMHLDATEFYDTFAESDVARRIENGDTELISEVGDGLSAAELAGQIMAGRPRRPGQIPIRYTTGNSPEYWAGMMLCYYQWVTCLSFAEISSFLSFEYVLGMHESYRRRAPEDFANELNALYRGAKRDTNLASLRRAAGLSQAKLAAAADIPVRTLQQYEQRQKDINKAQAEYIFRLARVLGCQMEDLIELV